MLEPDGNILVKTATGYNVVNASRWEELRESLKFHVELVKNSGTQGEFRFLNNNRPVMISPEHPEVSSTCKCPNVRVNVFVLLERKYCSGYH